MAWYTTKLKPKARRTMADNPQETSTQMPTVQKAIGVPAYLQENKEGTRLQGLDAATDFIIPRIKLLQGISPEVTTYEAAKARNFWHNVLNFSLGDNFSFIICNNRKRYLLVPPMGDDRGILARAEDGVHWKPAEGEWEVKLKGIPKPVKWVINKPTVRESGLAEFGTSNPGDPDSKPAATLFHEYLVYLPDNPGISPVLMSLARSQVRKAKDLNTKVELANQPIQAMRFKAGIIDDKGVEGPFFNYIFTMDGWASEEDFVRCVGLSKKYSSYRVAGEEDLAHEGEEQATPSNAKSEY